VCKNPTKGEGVSRKDVRHERRRLVLGELTKKAILDNDLQRRLEQVGVERVLILSRL
jgi:hypothetical protein